MTEAATRLRDSGRAVSALGRGYRLIDNLTQGYIASVGLLVLCFHGEVVPNWQVLVGLHAAALIGIHALIRLQARRPHAVLNLARDFYPIILYTFFYLETHRLQYMFVHTRLDPHIIGLEQWVFGCQPSRVLPARFGHWWLSEMLYLSYFSYYLMVVGAGLGLYWLRRNRFARYVTVVSLVFYVCYLTYVFVPVLGPYSQEVIASSDGVEALIGPRPRQPEATRGFFYHIVGAVYRYAEVEGGAAFPSSHVAVALVTLTFTWRYLKRVRWLHLVFVVLLCISTVYCGYHYAVDVVGGLVAAAVLAPLAEWLYVRDERRHAATAGSNLAGG